MYFSPAKSPNTYPIPSLEPPCTPTRTENPVKEEILSPLQYKRVTPTCSSDDSITHFSELVIKTPKKRKRVRFFLRLSKLSWPS